jgi:tetratricopeptide (TPR) repeat protein
MALQYLHEALDLEHTIERRNAGLVVKESYILHSIGVTHAARGDREQGRAFLERAKAAVESSSAVFNVVQMHFHLTALARLNIEEGRIDEALEMYDEAVELCRRTRHFEGLTTSLRVRGDVLFNLNRHADALPDLEEAAALYAHLGDHPAEALMWRGIAECRETLEDRAGALDAWQRTAEIAEGLPGSPLALEAAEGIAGLLRRDDPAAALKAYETALALTLPSGDLAKIGGHRYAIGVLRWEFGAYQDALGSFEQAYEDLLAGGDMPHAGLALNSIGRTLRDLGRFDEATERLEASISLNEENGERLLVAHALSTLGDALLDSDDPEAAGERFAAALEIRKELDDLPGQGWTLCSLAGAQLAGGSVDGAIYYLDEAEDIASRTADPELRTRCDVLRTRIDVDER